MNTKLIFAIIVTLYLAQLSNGNIVKRESASGPPAAGSNILTEGPLADILMLAKTQVASLQAKILEVAGVENQEQLITAVTTKAKMYAERVDGLINVIREESNKNAGQFNEIVAKVTSKLQDSVKQLTEQNPELVKATEEYKATVAKQFEGIVQETQKLATTLEQQAGGLTGTVQDALKGIASETAGTTTQLIENVNMAIRQKHDFPDKPQN